MCLCLFGMLPDDQDIQQFFKTTTRQRKNIANISIRCPTRNEEKNWPTETTLVASFGVSMIVDWVHWTPVQCNLQLTGLFFASTVEREDEGVSIVVWRYREMSRVETVVRQSNGFQFINLEAIATADQMLTNLLGLCCCFCPVTLRRLPLFNPALSNAATNLLGFAVMFSLLVFALIALFFLLFNSQIASCADLLLTTAMVFEMLLLKFHTKNIRAADALLGPLTFAVFMFFLVFIGCTMFISLIRDGHRVATQEKLSATDHDGELLSLSLRKAKRWFSKGDITLTEEWTWGFLSRIWTFDNGKIIGRIRSEDQMEQWTETAEELFIRLERVRIAIPSHSLSFSLPLNLHYWSTIRDNFTLSVFFFSQVEVTRSETAGSGRFLATKLLHGNRRWYSDRFLRRSPEPDTVYRLREVGLANESELISIHLNLMGHAKY